MKKLLTKIQGVLMPCTKYLSFADRRNMVKQNWKRYGHGNREPVKFEPPSMAERISRLMTSVHTLKQA